VFGGTIGAGLSAELDSLEPTAEAEAKVGYDAALVYLKGLATKLKAA
jgi:hypothetical protein